MASKSRTDTPQEAPWRASFLEHVNGMDSPEFVFSTLHRGSSDDDSDSRLPSSFLPRGRYCIFRGLWAELPANKHNEAPRNDAAFASDLPTFTTDVRMQKAGELFASGAGRADRDSLVQGSGGGGPCEAVWWAKDPMVQWRLRGTAFLVAPDIEGEAGGESSGVRTVKSEIGARMRVVDEAAREDWSWAKELTAHFGNLSPGMRGTFAAPPPGRPVDEPYDKEKLKLGQKIEDLHHEVARSHFRVVIIRPDEVESVDLSDPSSARRQVYRYDAASGQWSHQECWP